MSTPKQQADFLQQRQAIPPAAHEEGYTVGSRKFSEFVPTTTHTQDQIQLGGASQEPHTTSTGAAIMPATAADEKVSAANKLRRHAHTQHVRVCLRNYFFAV